MLLLYLSMAQFTAQGGVKSFFNVDSMSSRFENKDAFQFNIVRNGGGLIRFNGKFRNRYQKRKVRFHGTTRIYTLSENKSSHLSDLDVDEDDDDARSGDGVYDDYDFLEFGNDDLSCFRGLVLDVAYRPINVVCWKRAICLEFMEKADVLEYYDQTVNSPSGSFYIPAVLRVPHLLQFVKRQRIKNVLSRKNIFQRDNFTCQYCCVRENLTIDHVLPIARGGEWKWENLVAACSRCNSRKGQKTLEEASMKLLKVPMAPNDYDILSIPLTSSAISLLKLRKGTPEEWHQYLSKRSPLP